MNNSYISTPVVVSDSLAGNDRFLPIRQLIAEKIGAPRSDPFSDGITTLTLARLESGDFLSANFKLSTRHSTASASFDLATFSPNLRELVIELAAGASPPDHSFSSNQFQLSAVNVVTLSGGPRIGGLAGYTKELTIPVESTNLLHDLLVSSATPTPLGILLKPKLLPTTIKEMIKAGVGIDKLKNSIDSFLFVPSLGGPDAEQDSSVLSILESITNLDEDSGKLCLVVPLERVGESPDRCDLRSDIEIASAIIGKVIFVKHARQSYLDFIQAGQGYGANREVFLRIKIESCLEQIEALSRLGLWCHDRKIPAAQSELSPLVFHLSEEVKRLSASFSS